MITSVLITIILNLTKNSDFNMVVVVVAVAAAVVVVHPTPLNLGGEGVAVRAAENYRTKEKA